MKTALTQLIEKWETERGSYIPNAPIYAAFIAEAKEFLEAEKEQMMEVVEFCDAHCDDGHFDKEGAIANIKSTFNL